MKILFLYILMLPVMLSAQSSDYIKKEFLENGDTLRYNILYPSNYNPKKAYPIITYLHGSGERGNDNQLPLKHGGAFFKNAINKKIIQAIVIFPQCPENGSWRHFKPIMDPSDSTHERSLDLSFSQASTQPALMVKHLLDYFQKAKIADPARMYIGGSSLGGFGTFDMIERYPDYFAAAFPICGGGDESKAPLFAKKVSLWLFHGSEDNAVKTEFSRIYYKKLKELKADVLYTEYPGVGHDSWNNVFKETKFLPWLMSRKKN